MTSHLIPWLIAVLATAGVILRPFSLPEAVWAVGGAALLVLLGFIAPADAFAGVGKGTDVYLFLGGMMLLAEIAREEGLFDWLAALATRGANGSAGKMFLLVYLVAILVTAFLSNDATAVVMTPAVAAAVRKADAKEPLPYLLICAFVANAASFILPISNPANLVLYGSQTPPLFAWIGRYLPASIAAIAATFFLLRWTQRDALKQVIAAEVDLPELSRAGKTAAAGIAATALVLLAASAAGIELGLPTAVAGLLTAAIVLWREGKSPWKIIRHISWGVLPLVAGLFVLVEALRETGIIEAIGTLLRDEAERSATTSGWAAGLVVALAANLMNNLPTGLIASDALRVAQAPDKITRAVLVGVDLGPNLSVSGSLATILWLTALRREGLHVSGRTFLKLGCLIMPPALLLALGAVLVGG